MLTYLGFRVEGYWDFRLVFRETINYHDHKLHFSVSSDCKAQYGVYRDPTK